MSVSTETPVPAVIGPCFDASYPVLFTTSVFSSYDSVIFVPLLIDNGFVAVKPDFNLLSAPLTIVKLS